ncbi:MAG: hypothetical protein ABJO36_07110 [Litorimonas sp.]
MREFRPGDRTIEILGQLHRLRFTVSNLAEIAFVFQAEDPKALAARLRKANLADWNLILQIVATPRPPVLGPDEMEAALPVLSALIAEGLRT